MLSTLSRILPNASYTARSSLYKTGQTLGRPRQQAITTVAKKVLKQVASWMTNFQTKPSQQDSEQKRFELEQEFLENLKKKSTEREVRNIESKMRRAERQWLRDEPER